ncbi:MAG: DUF1349 domain-containing protein [Pseudolysinimonas sp.]|uniref:DUF1349 domain-containing protein n=1 Tax=Pseudolysinimonas sp. TaxID=2680009 RepID=UPI003262CDF1
MTAISIAQLPHPLTSEEGDHASVVQSDANAVTLVAKAGDDLFADPSGDGLVNTASLFTCEVTGDFQFSARIRVTFRAKFDSGALVGYFNDEAWFKICAEVDPLGQKRVVTVVTHGRSDDANSTFLVKEDVLLRIARTGKTFALHASNDGRRWDLVRYFTLNQNNDVALHIGIAAQSPAGEGTSVVFSDFRWQETGLQDSRDGS